MKVSGKGAAVGALVACVGRGAVVLLNIGAGGDVDFALAILVLPSAAIGLLIGALAGAIGRPLLGAAVGAVLSGLVFELFMGACASLLGQVSRQAGADFFSHTAIYGLEMALAGAAAGAVGGWVAKEAQSPDDPVGSREPWDRAQPAQPPDSSEQIQRLDERQ